MRRPASLRRRSLPLASFVAAVVALAGFGPLLAAPQKAALPRPPSGVAVAPVENLYARPDETSEVWDQAILGERLAIVEETKGFTRVRKPEGSEGWLPSRALVVGTPRDKEAGAGDLAEVSSNTAHVYREPDATSSRPVATLPLGARVAVVRRFEEKNHSWAEVALPDGRRVYALDADLEAASSGPRPARLDPASWIAMAKRFLGAPYTWGGTTPLGFDCSGLVQRVFERHGVRLKRNSSEMCFREPQLVPVAFEALQPGDLLFFGTEDKIDHLGIWIGDGRLIQATLYGVPSTQISEFATSPRLKDRFRYARRLAALPGAPAPGALSEAKLRALRARLEALAAGGGATYGIAFKDLAGGGTIQLDARKTMHAASTMKTAVLLEVLRRVDAGTLDLAREVDVKNEFRSVVDGSAFSVGLDPETDGAVAAKVGAKATLELLTREMIVRSSNLATNLVLTLVGPENVQRLCDDLGAPTVRVVRCVEDSKAFDRGLNNETDAVGMAALMEAAVRSPKLSASAKAKAWEILSGQVFNDQIPAGLHPQSGAVVGHKTGTISSAQHDAAVVRLPDGREYVLVLLATDFGKNEEGRRRVVETTKKMSRAVWDAYVTP